MGSDMLLPFCDFFWKSGLLKYRIPLYVWGHCFGCSLLPGTLPTLKLSHLSFRGHFPYLEPTTLLLFRALCLSIFNLSLTQNTCLFTSLSVCLVWVSGTHNFQNFGCIIRFCTNEIINECIVKAAYVETCERDSLDNSDHGNIVNKWKQIIEKLYCNSLSWNLDNSYHDNVVNRRKPIN